MARYASKKRKPKPRRKPARKVTYRCCGRTFGSKAALAAHRRAPKRIRTAWAPRPSRLPKLRFLKPSRAPKLPPVRKCAICGDPGDHGGDGHPYERWDEEPVRVRPRHPPPRPFAVRNVFAPLKEKDVLR